MDKNIFVFGKLTSSVPEESDEPIEWLVVKNDADSVLLVSRYCIAREAFCKEFPRGWSWVASDLRKWLNSKFYDSSFSDAEKSRIIETDGDMVSIPNKEIVEMLPEEYRSAAKSHLTYASSGYRFEKEDSPCDWWVREKGYNDDTAVIDTRGIYNSDGRFSRFDECVRVVICIKSGADTESLEAFVSEKPAESEESSAPEKKDLTAMTASELIAYAKEAEDINVCTEAVIAALKHLSSFCITGDVWYREDVRDTCREIGEFIYDNFDEMDSLKAVYSEVYYQMKSVAARYLEHFWDGIGDWMG